MFYIEIAVRNYECDLQGIVNNSVYQQYYEHTRHCYLKSVNLDFSDLHKKGLDLVVNEITIKYRQALASNDCVRITCQLVKMSGARIVFEQQMLRTQDNSLVSCATVTIACVEQGKPIRIPGLIADAVKNVQ